MAAGTLENRWAGERGQIFAQVAAVSSQNMSSFYFVTGENRGENWLRRRSLQPTATTPHIQS